MNYIHKIDLENNTVVLSDDTKIKSVSFMGNNQLVITVEHEETQNITDEFNYENNASKREISVDQSPKKHSNLMELIKKLNVNDVADYIIQNNLTYDNPSLQKHFLGKQLNSRAERKEYNKMKTLVTNAREYIEKEYEGEWVADESYDSRVKEFKFIKKY